MISIRQFKPDDMFAVIKIAHETLPEQYNPTVFNYLFESFPEGFLVAEQYQKIIGFIAGTIINPQTAKILLLAIKKDYRKQKIGTKILIQYFIIIKSLKFTKVELEVKTSNIPAISFYKKHGFIITDHLEKFYQDGSDADIMIKKI